MSAREDLVSAIDADVPIEECTRLVDAYAHELAEEIRSKVDRYRCPGCPECDWVDVSGFMDPPGSKWIRGGCPRNAELFSHLKYAADLIDPENDNE